jgi:hypothetical protein
MYHQAFAINKLAIAKHVILEKVMTWSLEDWSASNLRT